MSVQETTEANSGLEGESESGLKKEQLPLSLTEDEETFKGPTFCPPVYRRRYAAVCELVKKHQAKKVLFIIIYKSIIPHLPSLPRHHFPSASACLISHVCQCIGMYCPKEFGF